MEKKVFGAVLAFLLTAAAQAQQIPGMDFDTWSKTGGSWYPYAKDAPASARAWDSANKGLSLLGVNTTTPEYDHVAVSGKGKAAAKVVSKKVLWAFVAGNLFTGLFPHRLRRIPLLSSISAYVLTQCQYPYYTCALTRCQQHSGKYHFKIFS